MTLRPLYFTYADPLDRTNLTLILASFVSIPL